MKLKLEPFPANHDSLLVISQHNNENPCDFLWHYHTCCELVYVPFGSGRRQVGNHFSRFTNGDLVLIGPNVPHLNFNYEAQNDYEEVVIQFEREKLLSALALIPEFFKLSVWLTNLQSAIAFGAEIRKMLDNDIRNLPALPPFERVLSFLKVLHALSADKEKVTLDAPEKLLEYKAHEAERVNRIFAYVKSHYQSAINMEEVVELSGLSQEAFCRFFRKMTNMNFTEFVNEYRISKACQLLTEGHPVSQVAYASGFNTISHFNVTFKKKMQLAPVAYRKNRNAPD